jgi:hypothetical protein
MSILYYLAITLLLFLIWFFVYYVLLVRL